MFFDSGIEISQIIERFSLAVKLVRYKVISGSLLDRCFFVRRKRGVEVGHDLWGNVTSRRNHIRELPTVRIRPNLGRRLGVN